MSKKNLALGIATGVALLGITAFVLYRKSKSGFTPDYDLEFEQDEDHFDILTYKGNKLARKAKHKAEQLVSTVRKQADM